MGHYEENTISRFKEEGFWALLNCCPFELEVSLENRTRFEDLLLLLRPSQGERARENDDDEEGLRSWQYECEASKTFSPPSFVGEDGFGEVEVDCAEGGPATGGLCRCKGGEGEAERRGVESKDEGG